jgi:hypothetical protein
MQNAFVRVVLFLVPGVFLIALGFRLYAENAELSHVYGGITIGAGILAALGGLLIALPRRDRARGET